MKRIVLLFCLVFVFSQLAIAQEFISGIPPLPGASYTQAIASDLPQGITDIYTCPSGRRAILGVVNFFNQDSAGRTVQVLVKISGTYYKTSQPIGMSANAANSSQNGNQGTYVLNGGESLAIKVYEALPPAINAVVRLIEFSDLCGLRTVRLNSLSAGLNTLYTCSSNRRAVLITSGLLNHWDRTGGAVIIVNNTGTARSIQTYFVPNGGSPSSSNQFSNQPSVANTSIDIVGSAGNVFTSGDSIVINVDATGGEFTAYGTIYEY